tara:strand:- start:1269 stop:1970 length:702 start_codon:yes stop_codon:yes gene_type:complete
MSVEKKEVINLNNEFNTPPPNVTVREHPKVGGLTIKKKSKKEEPKERCSICLDNITKNKNMSTTPCGHVFCLTCLHEHLKTNNTCPNCRHKILDEMPAKPLHKITRKEAISIICAEINNWDFASVLEGLSAFKMHGRYRLISEFESMGLNIANELIALQNQDEEGFAHFDDDETEVDDEEFDEEDEEDDEEEENSEIIPINITIDRTGDNVTRRRIIVNDDDDSDDEEAEFEA